MARRESSGWEALAVLGAIFGTLGVVTLAGRSSRAAAPAVKRIALIGDSYAVGLGPELAKLIHGLKFEGVVGLGTADFANGRPPCPCAEWLASFRPTLVLVSLGVNDGTAPNLADYQAIVRKLHGLGARVVWIDPPAGVANRQAVRRAIAALGVPTVPATQTALRGDGVHPAGAGYQTWAREIAEAVRT